MKERTKANGARAIAESERAEERSALTRHTAAFGIDRRLAAADILQELLVDTIDLSLQAKQAHWNLRGPMFRDIHLLLDELVEEAGVVADRLAERCLALGVAADGRLTTLARNTHLEPFPGGRIADHQVVELIGAGLQTVSEVGRSRLGQLGELDLVSQDLVIEVLDGIEKRLWLLEAHRPAETG
ncbi:MAG: DNA starvation/stationary phase protection protein [Chloroflexota bacterium]|nr:MAG: DNA starvation/stationary phase protection protein [Chloroflexota bacterium]